MSNPQIFTSFNELLAHNNAESAPHSISDASLTNSEWDILLAALATVVPAFTTGSDSSNSIQIGSINTGTWIKDIIAVAKSKPDTPKEHEQNKQKLKQLIDDYHKIEAMYPAAEKAANDRISYKPHLAAPKKAKEILVDQMKTVREIFALINPEEAHPSTKKTDQE